MLKPRYLAASSLTIDIINSCVEAFCESFSPCGPIVEIGSRYSPGYERLADRRHFFQGKELIGCDLRPGPGVDRVEDAESLTFADDFAGTILLLETIEHLKNPDRALQEARRVLRSDGVMMISVPFSYRLHGFPTDYRRLTSSGLHEILHTFPKKGVLALGAAVKPTTVVAIAAKSNDCDFENAFARFQVSIQQRARSIHARLLFCTLQERGRDLLGLLLGRAKVSITYYEHEEAATKGYNAS